MNWNTRYANDKEQKDHYKYIKRQGDKWVVIQKGTGKILSHHDSREKAIASFRAMMMNKHASRFVDPNDFIDLTPRAIKYLKDELIIRQNELMGKRQQKEEAAALGDRSESGDYSAAVADLDKVSSRIRHIEDILGHGVELNHDIVPTDYVQRGLRVSVLHDNGETHHYWLTSLANYDHDFQKEGESDFYTDPVEGSLLDSLKKEHKSLSHQLDSANAIIDDKDRIESRIDSLKKEHESLKSQLDSSNVIIDDRDKVQSRIDSLKKEHESLKSQLDSASATIDDKDRIQSRIDELHNLIGRAKPLQVVTPRSVFANAILSRKVGERIHWSDRDGEILSGVITEIAKRYEHGMKPDNEDKPKRRTI